MDRVIVPYKPNLAGLSCPPNALGRFFGDVVGIKKVTIGPIAAKLITWRKQGMSPQLALHQMMSQLHLDGHKVITPETRDQLAAGLQKFSNVPGLGFLGAGVATTAAKSGATAASVAGAAGGALGLGSTILIAQTAIPIPLVGAAIGAVVGAALLLTRRHVGKAEASWTKPGFYASLNVTQGRDYDETQFSEAFKGMMDTGNNIVPGCGPDRHKDPDCLLGPMANVIAQGYLSGAIPLTATTQQVFDGTVRPWLQSGAGGLVNWNTLASEPVQLKMMQAATDRYLAGQPMTRGDMSGYGNKGAHTPTLVQVLQPILSPTGSAPVSAAPTVPYTGLPVVGGAVPVDQTAQLIAQLQAQGATQQQAYNAAMQNLASQGIQSTPALQNQVAADVSQLPVGNAIPSKNTASMAGGTSLPTWLGIGLAVVAAGFALARPQKRGGTFKRRR